MIRGWCYTASSPFGRPGSGGQRGEAGAVVVPAGAGLVAAPPGGPAELEGEAGGGDQACFPVAGEALDEAGLGWRQGDRGDSGRAGLPGGDGNWRVSSGEPQVSVGHGGLLRGAAAGRGAFPGWREGDGTGQGGLDGDGPQLGEGGQGGVPVEGVPGEGLGLIPAEGVLSRLERGLGRPPAGRDGEEVGQGSGAAFGRVAQVERVLVLVPVREAADQQEFLRVLRAEQRPVRPAGAPGAVPGGPPLECRLANRLVSAGDLAPREGDHGVAGDDDDVGQAERPQPGPEVAGPAVDLAGGGPQDPQPARQQALYLLKGQLRLGRELQALRDARLLPAPGIPR